MPTRIRQMFRELPPNYNPRSNISGLSPSNNRPHSSTPKLMSGVQAFTPKVLPHSSQNNCMSHEMQENERALHTADL